MYVCVYVCMYVCSEADFRSVPLDRGTGLSSRASGAGLKKGKPKEERGMHACMHVRMHVCDLE